MTETAPARLIELGAGRWIALPLHASLEVLDSPAWVDVPGAVRHCGRLAQWRGRWVPVLDFAGLLRADGDEEAAPLRYLLVVAYQPAPRTGLQFGAIVLPTLPTTIMVADAARCPLPENDGGLWQLIALSCFEHEGRPVPIVDTARLFAIR